ncbi:hypothetical protein GKZ89_01805 [Bacillus mangrovi]|uniref:Uncharacterized protein n=1 Tax=Metabacillus mangrovi TaxID=1491830 RepID=A0A7X2V3L2_9BACI|nr:hypothetical protein [Metabacillus mangrovi]MTH52123.1 hypothetical protein [Metabacillus mangrovi]
MKAYNKQLPDFKQLNDRVIAEPSSSPSIGAALPDEMTEKKKEKSR